MPGIEVLYVTRTGHAKALAEKVASLAGAKAAEIGDPAKRTGFIGFMKSGAQASRGADAPFLDPLVDLSKSKAVVLVQPIWASSLVPPLRSWIKAHKAELAGKKIGLLLSAQGSDGGKVRAKFEQEFGKLDAFATIYEKDDESVRDQSLSKFVAALK
jgi:hypothetical protein